MSACKKEEDDCADCPLRLDYMRIVSIELDTAVDLNSFEGSQLFVYVDDEWKGLTDFWQTRPEAQFGSIYQHQSTGCLTPCASSRGPCYDWCPISPQPKIEISCFWGPWVTNENTPESMIFSDKVSTARIFLPGQVKTYDNVRFEGEHLTLIVDMGFKRS